MTLELGAKVEIDGEEYIVIEDKRNNCENCAFESAASTECNKIHNAVGNCYGRIFMREIDYLKLQMRE